MRIEIKVLNEEFYGDKKINKQLLPSYSTDGSAAMDLICCEDTFVYPGEVKAIYTGLSIWIGSEERTAFRRDQNIGLAALILPRSGLGTRGLVLANSVGLIDDDYQGELTVQAWNRNDRYCNSPIILKSGERFAQLMFVPVFKVQWDVVEEFSCKTDRNNGGFGSTGL